MPWELASFQCPPSAIAIKAGLAPVLEAAPGNAVACQARLEAVADAVPAAVSSAGAVASVASAIRMSLRELMAAGGSFLCAHPYQHPVADRRGDYAWLTPTDAIQAVCAKLADPEDSPGVSSGAVAVLICASDHAAFSAALGAFGAVFPVTELQLAQRRAARLATLESDKLVLAVGPVRPWWIESAVRRHARARDAAGALGRLVAMAEGYDEENTRPEAELRELLQRKIDGQAAAEASWGQVAAMDGAATVLAIHIAGGAGLARRTLLEEPHPGQENKLAAVACWIGAEDRLIFIRELLGL